MLDLLMITHDRLEYLQYALPSVLHQNYRDCRLTIWDNGSEPKTVDWLKKIAVLDIPGVKVHFNDKNDSLAAVTSKVFLDSDAEFVGKVDSDMIIPQDWASRLVKAHEKYHFGFIGGFHFMPEDLEGIKPNIESFGGVSLWRKHHIGGAFVIRREDFHGYEGKGVMGLTEYQAEMGLVNGYLWNPILWVEHMEDARSGHYICSREYEEYKLKTRGIGLARYQMGIVNPTYMKENTL